MRSPLKKTIAIAFIVFVVFGIYNLTSFKYTSGFIKEISTTIAQIPLRGSSTTVIFDYSLCTRGSDTVYFPMGSAHFTFMGISNNTCVFYYGGEVENPNWDRVLTHKCQVPVSLGKRTYAVAALGIETEDFSTYCTDKYFWFW